MSAATTLATPNLDRLRDHERAMVLEELLDASPPLRAAAERQAQALLLAVTAAEVADRVVRALSDLDLDDLAARVGHVPGGYVHETDAAYQLVEQTLAPLEAELTRFIELGLDVVDERVAELVRRARRAGVVAGVAADVVVPGGCGS